MVGPKGLVIAQDIVPRYLDQLKNRVAKAGYKNVRFLLGSPSNPRLPAASVDRALLIHMYHEIGQPYALLYRLRDALRERRPHRHRRSRSADRAAWHAQGAAGLRGEGGRL